MTDRTATAPTNLVAFRNDLEQRLDRRLQAVAARELRLGDAFLNSFDPILVATTTDTDQVHIETEIGHEYHFPGGQYLVVYRPANPDERFMACGCSWVTRCGGDCERLRLDMEEETLDAITTAALTLWARMICPEAIANPAIDTRPAGEPTLAEDNHVDDAVDLITGLLCTVAAAGADPVHTAARAIGNYCRRVGFATGDGDAMSHADVALAAAEIWLAVTGTDRPFADHAPEEVLGDLAADTLHLARRSGAEPEEILYRARLHFDEEDAEAARRNTADCED